MYNSQATQFADARDSNPSNEPDPQSGRPRAVRNTLENGIRATDPVIEGHETHEDWLAHRETVVRELCPLGALETAYAERAALHLWRLNRVIRYEITATQFDLEDVIQEFIHALDHPELPRDRSEAVTIEKIRKDLRDYLQEFQRSGAKAAKLPELKDGLDRVRKEAKRIKEKRILPDQPTIQTIIKYEGHLQRCLASTMTELRRLQKERRQGLRRVIPEIEDHREDLTCIDSNHSEKKIIENQDENPVLAASPADSTKPEQAIETNLERKDEEALGMSAPDDVVDLKPVDGAEVQSPERLDSVDQSIKTPTTNGHYISEATSNGIVTHQKNAAGMLITMFPKTHDSAVPNVIVRPGPIALGTHINQKE